MALYRKYRPQSFDELVGQEVVKETLLSSFKNNKLSHAYLFVGPRGTGKTSTARILAKMVNCEKDNSPCNKCGTCVSITDGSNLDLIEIDAASNRGIEDIRSLREKIKLAPTSAKKKVYIIDEVHMLTQEAFNALLKTLEEPPLHALFILATTDVRKVPQTIISRTLRLDFKLAGQSELLATLLRIKKLEKINIDEEALRFLVKKAEGSFRDGVKLLDQVSSIAGKITAKVLKERLKYVGFDDIAELVENLASSNPSHVLLIISKQLEHGVDVKELILQLMDTLRNLVFIKSGVGDELVKPTLTEENFRELLKLSEMFSKERSVGNLDILQNALEKLKYASIPQLPLELAVVEICGERTEQTIDDGKLKIGEEDGSLKMEKQEIKPPPSIIKDPPSTIDHPSSNPDIQKLQGKWSFVLETIRPFNFSLEALLRSVKLAQCSKTTVVLEVPYSFHQRILQAPKNKDILDSILSDILGRSIQTAIVLGNRPQKQEDILNVEVAQDDEIIRIASEIFNSDSVN